MQVKNKVFYFHKTNVPNDEFGIEEGGWAETIYGGYGYRFSIGEETEYIYIEDRQGNIVSVPFNAIYEMISVLGNVQNELLTSIIGAPNKNG